MPPAPPSPHRRSGRRAVATVIGVALAVVIGWVSGVVPCPALGAQPACTIAMLPGPVREVDDLIEVSGTDTHASEGELLLTTIVVDRHLTLRQYLADVFDDDVLVVPRELFYPPGRSVEDAELENDIMMSDSQLEAKVAALNHLGVDLEQLSAGAEVVSIVPDGPAADSDLESGDVIVAVEDIEVGSADEAVDAIAERDAGDEVTLHVERGSERVEVNVTLAAHPDDPDRPFVGVLLRNFQVLPYDINIDAGAIGGPSAGLAFTLGIIDRLTPEDMTGGRVIAVTGTINAQGDVGPIGGITQKIVGASDRDEGAAEVFLVPAGNWDEAVRATPEQPIDLVRVPDLDAAVAALETLASGSLPGDSVRVGG